MYNPQRSYNRDHKEENRRKLFSLTILIGKYNFGTEDWGYFLYMIHWLWESSIDKEIFYCEYFCNIRKIRLRECTELKINTDKLLSLTQRQTLKNNLIGWFMIEYYTLILLFNTIILK